VVYRTGALESVVFSLIVVRLSFAGLERRVANTFLAIIQAIEEEMERAMQGFAGAGVGIEGAMANLET